MTGGVGCSADELMYPACDCYDEYSAHDSRRDYRQPLVFDDVEALQQSHACGDEEEPEVFYQKVAEAVDPAFFYDACLEGASKQYHAYDAGRYGYARKVDQELAYGEKCEYYATLYNHAWKVIAV